MTKWKCTGVHENSVVCCSAKCELITKNRSRKPSTCYVDNKKVLWEGVPDEQEQKPETELPDWCKVGGWVWLDPQKITGANGYEKVTNVDGLGLMFESGLMVCFSHRILQARLRPYNAKEMRGLVGKVVSTKRDCGIITGYRGEDNKVIVAWENIRYSAEALLEIGATIDGKPCGVLEHMENGDWEE